MYIQLFNHPRSCATTPRWPRAERGFTREGPMSTVLAIATVFVVLGWTASVATVLWRARSSPREARIALVSGIVVAAWAVVAITLTRDGVFQGGPGQRVPPVGINLVVSLLAMGVALWASPSLRRLVSRQAAVISL